MTTEELRTEIRGDIAALRETTERVAERVGAIAIELSGLHAAVDGDGKRHSDEIGVLFELVRKHEDRIATVERTYVERGAHERQIDLNRGAIDKLTGDLAAMNTSVTRLTAIASIVAGAVSLAANAALRWVG